MDGCRSARRRDRNIYEICILYGDGLSCTYWDGQGNDVFVELEVSCVVFFCYCILKSKAEHVQCHNMDVQFLFCQLSTYSTLALYPIDVSYPQA